MGKEYLSLWTDKKQAIGLCDGDQKAATMTTVYNLLNMSSMH